MPQIQLTITLNDAGAIGVEGPIENPLMALGIIELAKQAILDHNKQKSERLVQPAILAPFPPRNQ